MPQALRQAAVYNARASPVTRSHGSIHTTRIAAGRSPRAAFAGAGAGHRLHDARATAAAGLRQSAGRSAGCAVPAEHLAACRLAQARWRAFGGYRHGAG